MATKKATQIFERRRKRFKKHADAFLTLTDEEKIMSICSGHPPTEFEIQSFVYESLKNLGYEVRGEVTTKCGTCRFDIVVYKDRVAKRVIEIKKHLRPKFQKKQRKNQITKYEMFCIPVDLVCSLSGAKQYIESVKSGEVKIT